MSEERKGGWKITPSSSGKERRVYVSKDNESTIEELAATVGLEAKDFKHWGEVILWKRLPISGRLYPDIVSVPNVWIAVDALRGGDWYYDVPFVNPGGSLGVFFGTDMFKHEKKVEKFKSIKELLDFLKDTQKCKNVWGMIIFAHGSTTGYVGSKTSGTGQEYIIHELRKNNYRLARAFLMQCFSGYDGKVSYRRKGIKKEIERHFAKYFEDIKNLKVEEDGEGYCEITFDIDWRMEWGSVVATDPFTYKHMNVLMVDLDIFLRWF